MQQQEEALGAAAIEKELEQHVLEASLYGDSMLNSEEQLAREFNVTRYPVRLALHRLAARGLVVLHPGRRARIVNVLQHATLGTVPLLIGQGPGLGPTQWAHLEALLELRRLAVVESLARVQRGRQEDARSEAHGDLLLLNEAIRFRRDPQKALRIELDVWRSLAAASGSLALLLLMRTLATPLRHASPLLAPALSLEACAPWVDVLSRLLYQPDASQARTTFASLLAASDARALERLSPSMP